MSLDAIGIISQNIEKSIKFYGILGVHLKKTGGSDHFEGTTPSGVRIMVDSADLMKKINPGWKKPTGSGVILCFKQESPKQVDELFAKVTAVGFKSVKDPWDAFWDDYRLAAITSLYIPVLRGHAGNSWNWYPQFEKATSAFEDLGCREFLG